MGWSSYIRTTCGVEHSRCGATAGTGCRSFADASGNAGSGTFDARTAAESFHDGAAVNSSAAAHV